MRLQSEFIFLREQSHPSEPPCISLGTWAYPQLSGLEGGEDLFSPLHLVTGSEAPYLFFTFIRYRHVCPK